MGWTWALFLCHSALTHAMIDAVLRWGAVCDRDDAASLLLRDRAPAPTLERGRPLLAPYVDNGNVLAWSGDESQLAFDHLFAVLSERGFVLKDLVARERLFDMIGVTWVADIRLWVPRAERVARLRAACREAAALSSLASIVAQGLAGHMVNHCLLDRCCLSVLQEIFQFVVRHAGGRGPMTQKLRYELLVFASVAPLVYHEPGRAVAPIVYCSDSSLKGYALHSCRAEADEVLAEARWRERWRFREVDEEVAPGDELTGYSADLKSLAPIFDAWVAREAGRVGPGTARVPRTWRVPRPLIENPYALPAVAEPLLQASRWRRCVVGAWTDESAVHMKEARVALLGLKRHARDPRSAHSVVLSLGDNMGEVLAQDKGRAADHALNAVCRRGCAVRLGMALTWARRYVETDRNISDADSRLADKGLLLPGQVLRRGWRPTPVAGAPTDTSRPPGRWWASSCPPPPGLPPPGVWTIPAPVQQPRAVLEICGDKPWISGACAELGLRTTVPVGDDHFAHRSLFDSRVEYEVRRWVATGAVWCVVMRLPWCRAGLGDGDAAGADWRRLRMLGILANLLRACRRARVRVVVVGLERSPVWQLTGWRRELKAAGARPALVASCAHGTPYLRKFIIYSNIPGHQQQLQRHCACIHRHQPIFGYAEFYDDQRHRPVSFSLHRLSSMPPPSLCRSIAALLAQSGAGAYDRAGTDGLLERAWEARLYRAVGRPVGACLRRLRCPRKFAALWANADRLHARPAKSRFTASVNREPEQADSRCESSETETGDRRLRGRGIAAAPTRHGYDQGDLRGIDGGF